MIYPKFLEENATIGVTAPSSGVGYKLESYEKSLEQLKKQNWKIVETSNVRSMEDVSSPAKQRAEELDTLVQDETIDAIFCATGGDFLTDMLPYVNYDNIKEHAKWIMGASDPTNLLYTITTGMDVATIYGHNAGSFDTENLHESQKNALEVLKGDIVSQESYPFFEGDREARVEGAYSLTEPSEWKTLNGDVDVEGRIIGGCLDCLRYLPGTKYDHTQSFVKKYQNDGIIWYFDLFNMSSDDVYLTLFELKESGWFEHIKGVIVGRILVKSGYTSMTYEKAFKTIFQDIPIIMEADIGHVAPKMTIINGSIAHITCKNGKGKIEQTLK